MKKRIGSHNIFIIAEAGVNHNGSFELAKKLVDAAADAKADAVKFQTFKAENVISKFAEKAEYQKQTTGSNESQLDMVKKLEFSFDTFIKLKEYCTSKDIMFFSTPFDMESVEFLKTLNMGIWKIPSGEITNLPYLQRIASFNEEIIFSTGMATMKEIATALEVLIANGTKKDNITILHCNTEYPTPMKDVNLKAMNSIRDTFGVKTGYSDHTIGIEIPVAAAALGACVIEKHFTLDKQMEGPDHKASLDPSELKAMVSAIRNIEQALGSGVKQPSDSEKKNIDIARKSLHLARNIGKGEKLSADDLTAKRPGNGISPMLIDKVIGCSVKTDLMKDTLLKFEDIECK
jgi:N,N'-diacetyllegionaminate synthase